MTDATSPVSSGAIPEGGVILSRRILARISGPGTDKFVQGQFSQHVDDITETQSRRAAACTPKGRAYCITRFARVDGDLVLDLDEALAEATLTQLKKYLMLFRGTTMVRLEQGQVAGLIGEAAARSVAGAPADDLTDPGQALTTASSLSVPPLVKMSWSASIPPVLAPSNSRIPSRTASSSRRALRPWAC